MLPYLKKNQEAGVSAPVDKIERKPDDDAPMDYLEGCMGELSDALKSGDAKAAAAAFRSAFQIVNSEEGSNVA